MVAFERTKWLVLGLGGVGMLALAYSAGASRSPSPQGAVYPVQSERSSSQADRDTGTTNTELARLRRLERSVGALAQRLDDERAEAVPEGDAPDWTPQQRLQIAEIGRRTTVDIAKQRMATEPRQSDWAAPFEAGIHDGMTKAFPNLTLDSAECRSTLCEVRVGAKTSAEIEHFLADFPPALPDCDRVHYELITLADGTPGVELHMIRRETAEAFVQEVESTAELTFQEASEADALPH